LEIFEKFENFLNFLGLSLLALLVFHAGNQSELVIGSILALDALDLIEKICAFLENRHQIQGMRVRRFHQRFQIQDFQLIF
jgi:hypothetical protein